MKTSFRFFIIIMAAAALVSCSGPFSLSGDGIMSVTDTVRGDSIIPVPVHYAYNLNEEFLKKEHLSVLYVNYPGGTPRLVPIEQVEVLIDGEPVIRYLFGIDAASEGEKKIFVQYAGLSTYYTVKVSDPYGLGSGSGGSGGGSEGGSGIIIIGP
jgi:hypothetical protein